MTENKPSEAMVEAMARAIYEADDPWHVAWPWPDLQSDQAGVDHYRRCAEAAAAVVQAGLDDRASTTSPVDDSETGNTSGKPDIEAAVKSDTAPVSDKLAEAMALWERADRAGEDAYVEAVQIGVASADDAHKCGAIAAAAVIADALAERDAEIARLRPYVDAFRREESRADRLAQTVEDQAKQIEALREAHWFYLGDDCSSDQCRFDISECISEDFEWNNEPKGQHILQISGARPVPDMWVALHYYTDEEKDERGDDEPYTYSVHANEAEARAALGSAKV